MTVVSQLVPDAGSPPGDRFEIQGSKNFLDGCTASLESMVHNHYEHTEQRDDACKGQLLWLHHHQPDREHLDQDSFFDCHRTLTPTPVLPWAGRRHTARKPKVSVRHC